MHGRHSSLSFKTDSKTKLQMVFWIVSWCFGRGTFWSKKVFDSLGFKAVREVLWVVFRLVLVGIRFLVFYPTNHAPRVTQILPCSIHSCVYSILINGRVSV